MSVPVSVVIIAKNEQKRIKDCLESVYGWADEIVLVDDNSTDDTCAMARRYTDKVLTRPMDLEGKQRNFGANQARHDWIIRLDCDERLTTELKDEIVDILKEADGQVGAYWASQINYLGDVPLLHGGWSSPHLLLYNRKQAQYSQALYDVSHPGIQLQPGVRGGNLKARNIHYGFRNIEDFIAKINRYSTLEAIKWHLDGRRMPLGKALWRTLDRFFRRFIGKKGYKDGFYGFMAAVISAFHELAAYSKYREIKEKGYYIA